MKRTELFEQSQETMLLKVLLGWQQGLWTALPGIINSFDAATNTCTVKPAILEPVQIADQPPQYVTIPLLQDVPVFFPSAGGYALTFPVSQGDECLLVFSSRCIDGWFGYGAADPSNPPKAPYNRLHDLSDAFAFVGFRSLPRILSGIALDAIQLRDAGKNNLVEIKNGGIINIVSTASVNVNTADATVNASGNANVNGNNVNVAGTVAVAVTAPVINLNGNVNVSGGLAMTGSGQTASLGSNNMTTTGTISASGAGDITSNGKSLKSHVHGGVTTGSGSTGTPV